MCTFLKDAPKVYTFPKGVLNVYLPAGCTKGLHLPKGHTQCVPSWRMHQRFTPFQGTVWYHSCEQTLNKGTPQRWMFPREDFGGKFGNSFPACAVFNLFFFFKVENSLCTLTPFFITGSVHSGSAGWDDYGQVFPGNTLQRMHQQKNSKDASKVCLHKECTHIFQSLPHRENVSLSCPLTPLHVTRLHKSQLFYGSC